MNDPPPVLLLIDLQNDFLSAPRLFPAAGQVTARAARLLEGFRGAAWPVVHVWTTWRRGSDGRMAHWRCADDQRCLEGTAGHATPVPLRPRGGEPVVHKTGFSAFQGTDIARHLPQPGSAPLVLAGVHLQGCIRTSVLDAYQLGYEVWVAEDAVAGDDPLHGEISRRYLAARAAAFAPVESLLGRWSEGEPDRIAGGPILPAAHLGDRRLAGAPGGALPHLSPRRFSLPLWWVPQAGAREVGVAVETARRRVREWGRRPVRERCELVEALLRILEREAEPLARRLAVEIGKPLAYGRAEIDFAVELVRAAIGNAQRLPSPLGGRATSRRLPRGIVALVTPWNNPAAVPLGKLIPAVLLGNAVVWKPAPPGSAVALELLDWLAEVGFPPGLVSVVCGSRSTAERLMDAPGVDAVTLTGSEAAGLTAVIAAAGRGVPLQAELGGNNGAIVWGDADLDRAAGAVAEGAFGMAGQRCTATRRVIVERGSLEAFMEQLVSAAGRLGWGDPLRAGVSVGPLVSRQALERVAGTVDRARAQGCSVIPVQGGDGRKAALSRRGFYFPPTIVLADNPRFEIVQEETFGPVLVVQSASGWEEAIGLLNGVRQGLVASLFSSSPERRDSFLERAQAGVLKLGEATAGVAAHLPFGGWKRSGLGPPEHGESDVETYTRLQALYFGGMSEADPPR